MGPRLVFIFVMVGVMTLSVLGFLIIWATRYVKVGPNQLLIVSGRRFQLPDGKCLGFRIVKGGGTFVWPVFEQAERLSLEVFSIEMPKFRARTANGESAEVDCVAQVKINGDGDAASIVAAAEHFLGKSEGDMKNLVRPMLEKHLQAVLGNSSPEEIDQAPGTCADRVQAAASAALGSMGLSVLSVTLRGTHAK